MRLKLNVTLDFELGAQPTENKFLKTIHFIDESEHKRKDKIFTIKHLLRDISKRLGIDNKAEMSADLEGYLIPNDYPVAKILKEDDTIGVVFKSKSSTLLSAAVTETSETKQKTQGKRKLEEPTETKTPMKLEAKKNNTEETSLVSASEPKEEDASLQLGNKLSKAKKRQLRRLRVLKAVGLKETASDSVQPDVPAPASPSKPVVVKQEPIDIITYYTSLPNISLSSAPSVVEKWIAFKLMELGPDYCPVMSDFKRAKVLSFDAESEMISLQVAEASAEPQYDENGEIILRRFELPGSFTNLEDGVEVEYLVNDADAIKVVPFSYLEDVRKLPW